MNRPSSTLIIIALIAALVVVVSIPAIGEEIRSGAVALFGEKGSRYFGVVLNIITLSILLWQGGRRLLDMAQGRPQIQGQQTATGSSGPNGQPDSHVQAVQKVRADTNQVAQRLSDFAAEFKRRSPFRGQPGEALRVDLDSPEYQADQQQKSEQYSALMDEMRERYRVELLPDVIRVHGALADQGIRDTQLNALYQNPKNYKNVDTIAQLLWDMAGRLERRA